MPIIWYMNTENVYVEYNKKVIKGRRRSKKNGFYDRHFDHIFNQIIHCPTKRVKNLMKKLDMCPGSDGDSYKNVVFEASKAFFGEIIYAEGAICERSSKGGRIDIELPFRASMLYKYPFWKPWYYEYKIRSILIEVKNTVKGNYSNGVQLQGYLTGAKRGRFGLVVSRNGFTKNILLNLRSYTEDNNGLILPIDHNDLKELLQLSTIDLGEVVNYLSDKEKKLLQVA